MTRPALRLPGRTGRDTAYLHASYYFDPPQGDARHGRRLLEDERCLGWHSISDCCRRRRCLASQSEAPEEMIEVARRAARERGRPELRAVFVSHDRLWTGRL